MGPKVKEKEKKRWFLDFKQFLILWEPLVQLASDFGYLEKSTFEGTAIVLFPIMNEIP